MGTEGAAELLKQDKLLVVLGVGDQLCVDNLGQLRHFPGELQVRRLLLVLLIVDTFLFLLIRGLVSSFIPGLDLLVLVHSFVLTLSLLALFGFLFLALLILLGFIFGLNIVLSLGFLRIVLGFSLLGLISYLFGFGSLACGILLVLLRLFFHLL